MDPTFDIPYPASQLVLLIVIILLITAPSHSLILVHSFFYFHVPRARRFAIIDSFFAFLARVVSATIHRIPRRRLASALLVQLAD